VTPKGIVTQRRHFDWRSARWTLLLAGLTLAGLGKGAWELAVFGVERDAYFFNMIWAGYNLLFLIGALLVAWERPQRREQQRVRCELPARIQNGAPFHATTRDVSFSGCSLALEDRTSLPDAFDLVLGLGGGVRVRAELVYHEHFAQRDHVGVRFVDPSAELRRALLLGVFARSETWEKVRSGERRSRFALAAAFVGGLVGYFRESHPLQRRYPIRRVFAFPRRLGRNKRRSVWLRDLSPGGAGLLCTGSRPRIGELWRISELRWGRVVHTRRRLGLLWHVGIEEIEAPTDWIEPAWECAA
jgi:cellulose synthase (UDP-forming)